jgi:hypothetical protein
VDVDHKLCPNFLEMSFNYIMDNKKYPHLWTCVSSVPSSFASSCLASASSCAVSASFLAASASSVFAAASAWAAFASSAAAVASASFVLA